MIGAQSEEQLMAQLKLVLTPENLTCARTLNHYLSNDLDPNTKIDGTPLITYVLQMPRCQDKYESIELLLDAGGNVDEPNQKGRTALFYAEDYDELLLLAQRGANPLHEDNDGRRPSQCFEDIHFATGPDESAQLQLPVDTFKHKIQYTLEALEWVAAKQEQGALTFEDWVDQIKEIEQLSVRGLQSEDPTSMAFECWIRTMPYMLNTLLQEDDPTPASMLAEPYHPHWKNSLVTYPKGLALLQKSCAEAGVPLTAAQFEESGLLEALSSSGQISCLMHEDYWETRPWQELREFYQALPKTAQKQLFEASGAADRAKFFGKQMQQWVDDHQDGLDQEILEQEIFCMPKAFLTQLRCLPNLYGAPSSRQSGSEETRLLGR